MLNGDTAVKGRNCDVPGAQALRGALPVLTPEEYPAALSQATTKTVQYEVAMNYMRER